MAESKFLRYQDTTGDGLIDACDDLGTVVEQKRCPTCVTDPAASVPSWKSQTIDEPWLNQRNCMYQVTVVCLNYNTVTPSPNATDAEAQEYVNQIFKEYEEDAIVSLLDNFNKENTRETRQLLRGNIEYTTFDLPATPGSYVHLLYSLEYDILATLPEADNEGAPTNILDELADVNITKPQPQLLPPVTYTATELHDNLLILRRALYVYNLHYKVYRAVDGGNLVFEESGKVFDLEPYGDLHIKLKGTLGTLLKDLDKFLNKKDFNIPYTGTFGPFTEIVQEIKFTFKEDRKLYKMEVFTAACGENPAAVFEESKLNSLNKYSEAFRDPTAVQYFIKMKEMVNDLNARQPPPWIDFIKRYTYPTVVEKINYPMASEVGGVAEVGSCLLDSIFEQGLQLGQDLLDDSFGLKEAIAYKFNNNLCNQTLREVNEQRARWGEFYDPEVNDTKTLTQLATDQAYRQQEEETMRNKICGGLFGGKSPGGNPTLDQMWEDGFSRIKLCGLQDLLLESISCLIQGMTLDEALGAILQASLRAMGVPELGQLFGFLPPEIQNDLQNLVRQRLASQQFAQRGSPLQQLSDAAADRVAFSDTDEAIVWPWQDPDYIRNQKKGANTKTQPKVRTLAQQFDIAGIAAQKLDPADVHEAFIVTIIDYYFNDYFGLLDLINRFPGAKLIADTIVWSSCPTPPILDPGVLDTISDFELPLCRNIDDIRMPQLVNPWGWIPDANDWSASINIAFKLGLQQVVVNMMTKLMAKLCQLLGSATCKALEVGGDLAAGIPSMTMGENTFSNIVRLSICGENASGAQVDKTIVDLMGLLGPGAAAFADPEKAVAFASDISMFGTRREIMGTFLGDEPSNEFLSGIDNLIQTKYPEYVEGLPNKEAIGSFMANVGKAMPADLKKQARDLLDGIPEDDLQPANPSLCATEEDLENFCEHRASILSGRATPAQTATMCEQLKNDLMQDLQDMAQAAQQRVPLSAGEMPPIVSQPGCDDGLAPFEPEQVGKVATGVVGDGMEQLQVAYTTDMIGNGPWESDWGMLNMILSDTQGNPFTAHRRKVANDLGRKQYLDFAISGAIDDEFGRLAAEQAQYGSYPWKVGEWLQLELTSISTGGDEPINFVATNDYEPEETSSRTFTQLFGGDKPDLTLLPNDDYGVTFETDYEAERIKFITSGRKATSDVTLSFRDNNHGRTNGTIDFESGRDIELFLNDMQGPLTNKAEDNQTPINRPDSNVRIKISTVAVINPPVSPPVPGQGTPTPPPPIIVTEPEYEFLSVDNALDNWDPSEFPDLQNNFTAQRNISPQLVLLREMINKNREDQSTIGYGDIDNTYNLVMNSILTTTALEVSGNDEAFLYGAQFDDITQADFQYVIREDQVEGFAGGTPYEDVEIEDENGVRRKIRNKDHIFGISLNQYNNEQNGTPEDTRVYYLSPTQFGGSYLSPPVYVKPVKNQGWLGMVDIAFPELTACKPHNAELINFAQIKQEIEKTYSSIPEDERLRGDPACILEVPYNRILSRPDKAGIEAVITATLRIYASVHLMKAIATFTTFKPDFPTNFGPSYAAYVVEIMENSLKDAQGNGWELFNLFKDNEFWYGFLEQAVQTYGRKVDAGQITNPPPHVLAAINRLNNLQQTYPLYKKKDLKAARELGETERWRTLQGWKEKKVFEAVHQSEDDAKIVLIEMMQTELNTVAKELLKNITREYPERQPKYDNLSFYFFSQFCAGVTDPEALRLALTGEAAFGTDSVGDMLPQSGSNHYTSGSEFYVSENRSENYTAAGEGDNYVGYYHVHVDDNGVTQYMAGERHITEAHDVLKPYGDNLTVVMGDIQDWPYTPTSGQYFVLEKYMRVNGVKMSPADAAADVATRDPTNNISDDYPGTLAQVFDPGGRVVGLEGELGLRNGIQLSIVVDGDPTNKRVVASAELDVLDVKIDQFETIRGNSKSLLCLVQELIKNPHYQLLQNYILSMPKITSAMAIYNDINFLTSIGEVTVPVGADRGSTSTFGSKPGASVAIGDQLDDGTYFIEYTYTPGWAAFTDRDPGWFGGWFVTEWDNWDRILLRNSKSSLKQLFKTYYYSREWEPGTPLAKESPSNMQLRNLRQAFSFDITKRMLPWWKWRKIRSNPFNAQGQMCSNFDES